MNDAARSWGEIKATLSRAITKPRMKKAQPLGCVIFLLFTINSYQTLDKQNARCLLKKEKLFSAEDYKRNLTQTDLSKQREDETDLSATQDHEKRLGAPVSVVFSPTTSVRTGCISYQCALPSAVKARRADHVSFDHRV